MFFIQSFRFTFFLVFSFSLEAGHDLRLVTIVSTRDGCDCENLRRETARYRCNYFSGLFEIHLLKQSVATTQTGDFTFESTIVLLQPTPLAKQPHAPVTVASAAPRVSFQNLGSLPCGAVGRYFELRSLSPRVIEVVSSGIVL